jgi:DNA-binding transcriptional ArsR family regulator
MDARRTEQVAAIAALAEPTRRRVYEHVVRQPAPVGRDEVVAALGLPRATAAFHLERLVADGLLDGGLLWRLHDNRGQVQEVRADRECLFRGWPLAVLVDRGTSGQAAAVAAALQDNGRAALVGEGTRGEGYVNSLVALPDGQGSLALRTGRVERAAKDRGWPVQPDQPVALSAKQREALYEWQRRKELSELPPGTDDRPPEDPQLAKAVELLQAALKKSGE